MHDGQTIHDQSEPSTDIGTWPIYARRSQRSTDMATWANLCTAKAGQALTWHYGTTMPQQATKHSHDWATMGESRPQAKPTPRDSHHATQSGPNYAAAKARAEMQTGTHASATTPIGAPRILRAHPNLRPAYSPILATLGHPMGQPQFRLSRTLYLTEQNW